MIALRRLRTDYACIDRILCTSGPENTDYACIDRILCTSGPENTDYACTDQILCTSGPENTGEGSQRESYSMPHLSIE